MEFVLMKFVSYNWNDPTYKLPGLERHLSGAMARGNLVGLEACLLADAAIICADPG